MPAPRTSSWKPHKIMPMLSHEEPASMRQYLRSVAVFIVLMTAGGAAQRDDRQPLTAGIDARREHYGGVAKQIWAFAELGYQEQKSSALLQQELRAAGFQVKGGVAEIPTAFVATFGSGKPIIGIVGEFDALPGLSQEAQSPAHHAIEENAPGHGCGHNLLGTGALAAAVAVKDWMTATGQKGTLRYYGT